MRSNCWHVRLTTPRFVYHPPPRPIRISLVHQFVYTFVHWKPAREWLGYVGGRTQRSLRHQTARAWEHPAITRFPHHPSLPARASPINIDPGGAIVRGKSSRSSPRLSFPPSTRSPSISTGESDRSWESTPAAHWARFPVPARVTGWAHPSPSSM